MADSEEQQVTSTTLLSDAGHHYEPEPEPELDQPKADHFSLDDIVDLVGGARDALERHIAEDSAPHEPTQTLAPEEPPTLEEPVVIVPETTTAEAAVSEPEPVVVPEATPEPVVVPEPVVIPELVEVPEPEPAPITVPEPTQEVVPEPAPQVVPEPEPTPVPEAALPDSTTPSIVPEVQPVAVEEPAVVVAPKAEAEVTWSAPVPEPAPAPAPVSDALPVVEAPAPAQTEEQPAVTEEPPAPAAYVPSPPKAQLQPLMQFPAELGQKGDSPAPISPLSPLHSPDSLEELSLTESPNQPPASGFAASLGSYTTQPPTTHSKNMPWEGEDRSQNKTDLLDTLAGPYLSLGKDPVGHNPCEDSGVSFSPEEKMASSGRSSTGPSPVTPQMMLPESDLTSSNPTEHWDSPFLTSQDNSKNNMDPFSKETTPIGSKYESDLPGNNSDEDDDLMCDMKKNNNPFDGFSPLADSGYSHFGESKSDSRNTKMSESPTPDLVQYGQTGESLDSPPSFLDEADIFDTGKMASGSFMQSMNQFSSGVKDLSSDLKDEEEDKMEDDLVPPPSLPDILKSSPLNPDKMDSGSSEGTPEDQSPILVRKMMESPNPPINLSNNPFAFEGKVSLLKEMAEEMEGKTPEHTQVVDEKAFDAFDLVKEAEPTKVKEEPVKIEQKDWFSGFDSPKKPDNLEPLDFKNEKLTGEDSDSDCPTADSLSPVLEAMAKNPASFQVETDKKDIKMDEADMAEEVSEHEVSSEEFEFIERPPRGVIDEFLEALDTSKFASSKTPEIPMDDDLTFGRKEESPVSVPPPSKVTPSFLMDDEVSSQSSYLLLSQSSPQKSKAELEKLNIQQPPPKAPATQSPAQNAEAGSAKKSALFKMPNVNIKTVVELLYWRDVKSTGAVFGAILLLLLSLTMCSIVSVCSYIGLALLSVTICFRIYKGILQAIQKSDDGHPFKQYLDQEVALSEDMVHKYSDAALNKINKNIADLRRVFLVEDLVDSIKFAVLMWILTYVGALFNGLTIVILGVCAAFSFPIIYEKHQAQIDHYLGLVNNQIKDVVGKIQEKVPGMKRKSE